MQGHYTVMLMLPGSYSRYLSMVNFNLLLSYRGLPSSWAHSDLDNLSTATQMKLEKAVKTLQEVQRGGVVYISGDPAVLLGSLWEEGTLDKFTGLDFSDYFDSKMDKDRSARVLNPRQFTFIYGVGNESALNKAFSGQLLSSLVATCRDNEVWCFICGNMSLSKFQTDYGVSVVNSITLPNKAEVRLI